MSPNRTHGTFRDVVRVESVPYVIGALTSLLHGRGGKVVAGSVTRLCGLLTDGQNESGPISSGDGACVVLVQVQAVMCVIVVFSLVMSQRTESVTCQVVSF